MKTYQHPMPKSNEAELTLTLKVRYQLDGTTVEDLKRNLTSMMEEAIGNGRITGDYPATVITHSYEIK